MIINDITNAIQSNRIRITDHADEEAIADNLKLNDIFQSVFNGEVIENYPNDKPYPSCLIFGMTENDIPIHSVWAYNKENKWSVLITVYRPDPSLWIDWRVRRKK